MSERQNWVALELAAWDGVAFAPGEMRERMRALAADVPSIALFNIDGTAVRLDDDSRAALAGERLAELYRQRADLYAAFLSESLRAGGVKGRGTLALGLHDRDHTLYRVPVFEYQKVRGSNAILMPDVDLLNFHAFDAAEFADATPFEEKSSQAFFVGSTTGGIITEQTVRTLDHPRLQAAVFFKDLPDVVFDLPTICQCDSAKTEALVRALGVQGRGRKWAEQFGYRYLLSIDGNGAACSRVALALRSGSVLVKYASAWQLFYFKGLDPWIHYIPVRNNRHVMGLMEERERTHLRDRTIADNSQAFARNHLSWAALLDYTAGLLDAYLRRFGG